MKFKIEGYFTPRLGCVKLLLIPDAGFQMGIFYRNTIGWSNWSYRLSTTVAFIFNCVQLYMIYTTIKFVFYFQGGLHLPYGPVILKVGVKVKTCHLVMNYLTGTAVRFSGFF